MIKCGIDIGGTNIKFGYFDENNKLLLKTSIKTSKNKDEIIDSIVNEVKRCYNIDNIKGYTVAIPGVLKDNIVEFAPNTNIVGLNFYEELSGKFNNCNIIVENDANLAALAEAKISSLDDLVLITLGTGVGSGIIIDGNLYNKNGYAGEIGHLKVDFSKNARICGCNKKGCVDAYCSSRGFTEYYNKKNSTNINAYELFKRSKKGDYDAISSINYASRKLAIAIQNLVSILGIKNIRLSGGLSNAKDDLLLRVKKYYKEYAFDNILDISIKIASLGSDAGIYIAQYLI